MTELRLIDSDTKVCRVCFADKPLAQFHRHRKARDGHTNMCKPCAWLRQKAGMKRQREKVAEMRRRWLMEVPQWSSSNILPVPAGFATGLASVIRQIGEMRSAQSR